jgi:large subunit ribosomal protein L10
MESSSSNSLRLAAKPGQMSPDDVSVKSGETGIQPGQTVTDLKSAGIDVQIQKGKVVIAKDKIVVKKGEVISSNMAKALHTLDILPFHVASIEPINRCSADGIMFTKKVLAINAADNNAGNRNCFRSALSLCS